MKQVFNDSSGKANKQNLTKRVLMIALSVLLCLAVFSVLLFTVIIPSINYNKALDLYNEGRFSEAIAAFEELNGYKDSVSQISACQVAIKERQ